MKKRFRRFPEEAEAEAGFGAEPHWDTERGEMRCLQ